MNNGTKPRASEVVACLPDGFYFFNDPHHADPWGIIHRVNGMTWRIGESAPMKDSEWDDDVTFYKALPPGVWETLLMKKPMSKNKPASRCTKATGSPSGVESGKVETCPACGGSGRWCNFNGMFNPTCSRCNGTGRARISDSRKENIKDQQ